MEGSQAQARAPSRHQVWRLVQEGSGCGGGVGSGTGVTAISVAASGSGRVQDSRQACQPNDITASPITWSMRAIRKAKNKDVCITRLASFQT
jgi:hypothetical protein